MAKTAFQMTPDEWKKYHPSSKKIKNTILRSSNKSGKRDEALEVAKQAAELLRNRFNAKKVVLFGSTATNVGFSEFSDIDLAAWGIPADQYYLAVASLTGLSSRFKIDLIDPDSCLESMRDSISSQGVLI